MVQAAPVPDTCGVGETTNVYPAGAAVLCTARTSPRTVARPYRAPSYQDSTHRTNAYNLPSGKPPKVRVAPSDDAVQGSPSGTIPQRNWDPSPPETAEPVATTSVRP